MFSNIASTVAAHLGSVGFKKRTGAVFTCDVSEDVLGWLGLNKATRHLEPGQVQVNPVVGIRDQRVERICAELRGDRFHPYQPPTVSTPLAYLMQRSQARAWVISADNLEAECKDLADAVIRFGQPFMRSGSSLPEVCRLLDQGLGFDHQIVFRRPVAWMLAGDSARASSVLSAAEDQLGGRVDAAAQDFRSFAAAFRGRFGIRSSG